MVQLKEFSNSQNFELVFSHAQRNLELSLRYRIRGPVHLLYPENLPSLALSKMPELWKKTCLEAFLFEEKGERYCELNFNILGEYSFLFFESYREPCKEHTKIEIVGIQRQLTQKELVGEALLKLPPKTKFLLSPTAILAPKGQEQLFFALEHGGKADFHSRQAIENKAFSILT